MGYGTVLEGLVRLERATPGTGIAMLERGGAIPEVAKGLLLKEPTERHQAAITLLPVMDRFSQKSIPAVGLIRYEIDEDRLHGRPYDPQYNPSVEQALALVKNGNFSGSLEAANALGSLIGGRTIRAIDRVSNAIDWATSTKFTRTLEGGVELSEPITTRRYLPLARLAGCGVPKWSLWRKLTGTVHRPVVNVPLSDAQLFATTLALLTGEPLRLASLEQLREAARMVVEPENTTDPITGSVRWWAVDAHEGWIFGSGQLSQFTDKQILKTGARDVSFRLVRSPQPGTSPAPAA